VRLLSYGESTPASAHLEPVAIVVSHLPLPDILSAYMLAGDADSLGSAAVNPFGASGNCGTLATAPVYYLTF
jgi:hypothetical protein